MAPDPQRSSLLTADYQNEQDTARFQRSPGYITADAPTAQRVDYLSALRSSVVEIQAEINVFLTKKMDEDKAAAGKTESLIETKEEENYGEEVVEES